MRVTSQNVINETAFSAALRKSWNVHPDTVVEALGSNYFLVQFLVQMEMLRLVAKGVWKLNKGDMVVTRPTKGPEDLTEPRIEEADCWVELHGVPPESWDLDGIQSLMKSLGAPLTEITTYFYGNKRVYKQKLKVNIAEPLKPKVPLRQGADGVCWAYVVYDNVANVCRFCARIGHEHGLCPVRYRMIQMQQQEQYRAQLGDKPIPETNVGKWITDRTIIPRKEGYGSPNPKSNSSLGSGSGASSTRGEHRLRMDRKQKRPVDLNEGSLSVFFIDGSTHSHTAEEEMGQNKHLNCKRARETIPNSSPNVQ